MRTRTKLLNCILFILLVAHPTRAFGQSPETPNQLPCDKTTKKQVVGRKHGTYFKLELVRWQGDIFGKNSITRWEGNLFGSDYNLTSVGGEVETYFNRTHLQLSGWSAGYRKDDLRYNAGHMFSGTVFRSFNLKIFEIKPSVGMEWGMPATSFDKTKFDYGKSGVVHYRRTYPVKNSNVPFVGTRKDGAIYPFVGLSILQRPGPILFETGMRINIINFGIDEYNIVSDHITYDFKNKKILVPYLFISIGVKMF